MTDRSHEGGCLCGAIRYRIQGEPIGVGLCYCRSCQRATGGPVAGFVDLPPGGFVWTAGEPAFYASSPGVKRGFCPQCGTALTFEADDIPGEVHLLSATIDDPTPWVPLEANTTHSGDRISWLQLNLSGDGENA